MSMFGFRKKRQTLNLALQGGGAHGAFTWGVLDRLLDEPDLDFGWVSGTSAGAVNAVALASGLDEAGREGAKAKLRAVWEAVIEAGVSDLLRLNPFIASMARSPTMERMAALFSPYEFNPLGFDPMRKLLESAIDFDRLRKANGVGLLIAATDVATARPRLFRRNEMSVDAVLASACLPQVHHAVEIEGRHYWDGGYSANPDLVTLAAESPTGDTLLILLNPVEQRDLPRSAREIAAEVSRVTFTQPLVRDAAEITACIKDSAPPTKWRGSSPRNRQQRLAWHRYHMIEAGRHTLILPADSKMRPERAMLTYLYEAGRNEADLWLDQNRAAIGSRSTIDLQKTFFGTLTASPPATAIEPPLPKALEQQSASP